MNVPYLSYLSASLVHPRRSGSDDGEEDEEEEEGDAGGDGDSDNDGERIAAAAEVGSKANVACNSCAISENNETQTHTHIRITVLSSNKFRALSHPSTLLYSTKLKNIYSTTYAAIATREALYKCLKHRDKTPLFQVQRGKTKKVSPSL